MKFILEGKELKAAKKFIKKQKKKDGRIATAGERWTYSFTPTGLGTVVKIKDELLGDKKDLTYWDCW